MDATGIGHLLVGAATASLVAGLRECYQADQHVVGGPFILTKVGISAAVLTKLRRGSHPGTVSIVIGSEVWQHLANSRFHSLCEIAAY